LTDVYLPRLPPAGAVADRFLQAVEDEAEARELQTAYAAMLTEQRLPWLCAVRPIFDASRAPGRKKAKPRKAFGIYLVYAPDRTCSD
jgi:hypothetical protein